MDSLVEEHCAEEEQARKVEEAARIELERKLCTQNQDTGLEGVRQGPGVTRRGQHIEEGGTWSMHSIVNYPILSMIILSHLIRSYLSLAHRCTCLVEYRTSSVS